MMLRRLVLSVLLALAVPPPLAAQEPAAPPKTPPTQLQPPRFANQNVRIEVTITLKGEKPLVKRLSLVAADGRETKGRAGIEIPIATGMGGGPTALMSFNYRPVGVNIDATPQILDATKVLVRMSLEFSTVYRPEAGQQADKPSFGQGSHEARAIVFESGKPLVVTQASDAESGREYTVEVKATILP
jgi:Flp pilus assembly secretin CpaC